MNLVITSLLKVLTSMAMKLIATSAMEEFILWGLKQLVAKTESKADDELLILVEKALKG